MSANLSGPPDAGATLVAPNGGLAVGAEAAGALRLDALPLGARLILRCRKDWRTASVAAITPDQVVLSVASPTGHTYRVRRPHDAALTLDGAIPILGEGTSWRAGLARYDTRW